MPEQSEREILFRGAKFDLERIAYRSTGGKLIRREVIRHPGAVCILPLLRTSGRDEKIVMIRNLRPALGEEVWELPAGTLEPPEPPDQCADRELIEETGYRAERFESLGSFFTTPGMTDELMRAFVATDLTEVGQQLEEDESIRPVALSVDEVFGLLDTGELKDGKSMLTLLLAARRGLLAAPAWERSAPPRRGFGQERSA
jgi:ADP-ribose pyrophosphatase